MRLNSIKPNHWKKGLWNRFFRYSSLFLSDRKYIEFQFKYLIGYSLNLEQPQTFNEKLNWLKFNFRKPIFTKMADKFEAKEIVRNAIGEEYVVPLLGVWSDVNDIDFEKLQYPCVLKATNDSSGVIICKSYNSINVTDIKRRLSKSIGRNWYSQSKEWVYKDITPRIIADQYLDDHSGHELTDYKFWCFNGKPRVMYCTNKAIDIYENFYDMDFRPLDISHGYKRRAPEFIKPDKFEQMKKLCEKLSAGLDLPFVRIDFFYVNGHIYFGEFTFYEWGGIKPFTDINWDYKLGKMLKLPN